MRTFIPLYVFGLVAGLFLGSIAAPSFNYVQNHDLIRNIKGQSPVLIDGHVYRCVVGK